MSDKTVTIEANQLEAITLTHSAGPAAIGNALEKIYDFLDSVLVEALHSRELKTGAKATVILSNVVASLGQATQIFKGSSGLAGVQMMPPGQGPM